MTDIEMRVNVVVTSLTRSNSAPAGFAILQWAEQQPSLKVRIIKGITYSEEREDGAQVLVGY
jgi:hypothetical protein